MALKNWKLTFPLKVYLLWRATILFFQLFLQPHYLITADSSTIYQRIYLSWTNYWDVGHYLGIAAKGYVFPQQAFFPLWPLLIKFFSFIFPVQLATFLLSFLLGLSTFILFYNLAGTLVGEGKAKLALILFASFPSVMFLLAGYTEGLFLSLTLLSFILLEKKFYLFSALTGGLATLTRLVGVGIAASYLILKTSLSKKILYISLALSGIAIYAIYLFINYGDPLYFIKAEQVWCSVNGRCSMIFPLLPIIKDGESLFFLSGPSFLITLIDWLSTVTFLLFLIPVYQKLPKNYSIYSAAVIALPLFSGTTTGMIRYTLAAFPVFMVAPLIVRQRWLFYLLCSVLFILELRDVALFSSKMWVA